MPAPLEHIRVIEFSHMVMGPSMGVILGDLGADVIKIEPIGGDKTRKLRGSGAGYFAMYNRNKRSIEVDLKHPDGRAVVERLVGNADVLIENFREGTMARLGFGYEAMSALNEKLVYCSARGFLAGPYDHRTALDEVAQMMGGLAYMTGPPGRPLRAGASVIDVAGGMFGVIAIQAALEERHRTGRGKHVSSALYESTAFFVGQHMAQYAVTGSPAKPMPVRISAWAVYDIFEAANGEKVFVGVVSDTQWRKFCEQFELDDFAVNEAFATNTGRVEARDTILPAVRSVFASMPYVDLLARLERCGLPFAPIAKPEDLFDDEHLNGSDGLVPLKVPEGEATKLPALPITFDGERCSQQRDLPAVGADTDSVLSEADFSAADIERLRGDGVIG
ncbi:MAG: CaiB/BaiF CoA-transferase family protein [Pseudomonadota bacterium]